MYTRAHIRLDTNSDAINFVQHLNADGSTDKYILESTNREYCVDARSLLGVLYFISEHHEDTFLVNKTADGHYPSGIDEYRI